MPQFIGRDNRPIMQEEWRWASGDPKYFPAQRASSEDGRFLVELSWHGLWLDSERRENAGIWYVGWSEPLPVTGLEELGYEFLPTLLVAQTRATQVLADLVAGRNPEKSHKRKAG